MTNRVILIGRTTGDIDLQKTNSGKSVCTFTIATDEGKSNGEKKTQFTRCEAWNQSAEFLAKYSRKGSMISVEGRIDTRSYEKDGKKNYTTLVVADRVSILTTPKAETPERTNEPLRFDTGSVNVVTDEDLPW